MSSRAREVVVCLGAGRSGTSLTMQVLSKCGLSVSEDMIPPSEQNPEGGYEDKFIFDKHSEIYRSLNLNHFIPIPSDILSDEYLNKIEDELSAYIESRLESSSTWGFKDPRTSAFLPMWKRIFNTRKIVPKYVLCVRSPDSVVASLKSQYNFNEEIAESFWLCKYLDALSHTGGNLFIVHYELWFGDRGAEQLQQLIEFTRLPHRSIEECRKMLDESIRPELNRSQWIDIDVRNSLVRKLYSALVKCNYANFDHSTIMLAVSDCQRSISDYKGWQASALKLVRQTQERIKSLKEELDKLTVCAEEERRRYAKRLAELESKVSLAAEYKEQLTRTMENVQRLNKKISSLKTELALHRRESKIELAVHRREAKALSLKCDRLEAELNAKTSSTSFRVGVALVDSVARPGLNTFLLPLRLVKLMVSGGKRRFFS